MVWLRKEINLQTTRNLKMKASVIDSNSMYYGEPFDSLLKIQEKTY